MRGQVGGMALYSVRDRTGRLRSDEARAGCTGWAGLDKGDQTGGERGRTRAERGQTGTRRGRTGGERGRTRGETGLDWKGNGVGLEGEQGRTAKSL